MPRIQESTRRQFFNASVGAVTGALAAPVIVSARALGRCGTAASDRLTVGIIGSGGRAVFETRQYPSFDNVEIVAVCDAQESRRLSAKSILEKQYAEQRPGNSYRGIRMYADFHELLAQKDIDAVYIAAPDHWHVSMLIPSLAAGKHVHCEKPLGVSVEEDLAARNAARKYKKVFQYGAELRSNHDTRKAAELVLNGRIGKVQKIYVVGPPSVSGGSATPVLPIPKGFDYDSWLGPAPVRPFCADLCLTDDPRGIFNFSDYTLGNIANWAAHPLDQMQRWADAVGRTEPPVHYEGSGKFPTAGLFDVAIQWNVRCTWADGLVLDFMDSNTYHELPDAPHPPVSWTWSPKDPVNPKMENGAVFVGSEGFVIINYPKVVTSPASLMDSVIGPNEIHLHDSALATIPEGLPKGFQQTLTAGHHQDWVRAIRTGSPVADDIESAFRSDMISQLSDLCIRTGAPIRWDPATETILGNDMARMMMRRAMRPLGGLLRILIALCAAAMVHAADAPLYVFDNGVGAGSMSIEEQAELAHRTGYAGIFYDGTKNIPQLLAAHQVRGMKVLGIYTGMNLADHKPSYDPGLPEAIRQLKGSGALIAFTVNGTAPNADELAVSVVREVADMAAEAGLKVALYPHYGMHVARIEDALRVREKVNRPNLGVVFNLCHWLRSGDEANMAARVKQAVPYTLMVSINGADREGDWDRLIQTLDRGAFNVKGFLDAFRNLGYKGPVGLQCYGIKGDREENLKRSMAAWRSF